MIQSTSLVEDSGWSFRSVLRRSAFTELGAAMRFDKITRSSVISALVLLCFAAITTNERVFAFDIPSQNQSGSFSSSPLKVGPGQLVLAIVVARHGDRAPQHHAPAFAAGDRHSMVGKPFAIDYGHWPVDYGQLTEFGMHQMREFGRKLRERYIVSKTGTSRGFLSHVYEHAETHVRSTDVDRTLVSAMNAMIGLYEESDKSSSKGKLQTRVVVPVHTVEYKNDALMDGSAKRHCPRFFNAGKEMLQTGFCRGAIMRNTALLDALPSLTGWDTSNASFEQLVQIIAGLRDLRVCQRAHNISQPMNVTQFDRDLDDIVARISIAKWDVPGLGVLVGGRLLRAVSNRMVAMTKLVHGDKEISMKSRDECNAKGRDSDEDGSCPRKLVVYTGHDTTIFDVRSALGLHAVVGGNDGGVAPYGSHVIFELRRGDSSSGESSKSGVEDDLNYNVTVLHGSHSRQTEEIGGPFCGGQSTCSLKSFLSYVDERVPDDVDEACGVTSILAETDRQSLGGWPLALLTLVAAAIVGAVVGYFGGNAARRRVYERIPDRRD